RRKGTGKDCPPQATRADKTANEEEGSLDAGIRLSYAPAVPLHGIRGRRRRAAIPAKKTPGDSFRQPFGALFDRRRSGDFVRQKALALGALTGLRGRYCRSCDRLNRRERVCDTELDQAEHGPQASVALRKCPLPLALYQGTASAKLKPGAATRAHLRRDVGN